METKEFNKIKEGRDLEAERKSRYSKPKQSIQKDKGILKKLVNLDPYSDHSFDDILKPEETKAIERINYNTIFWGQILRVISAYTIDNDLAVFINAVEILEATMGSELSKQYESEVRELKKKKDVLYFKQIKGTEGNYENPIAIMNLERGFWLQRYKIIINELTRKGLWVLKGH